MNFVSYSQLAKDVSELVEIIPKPKAILGIPRSGMIPAAMMALHWNIPYGDVHTFAKDESFFKKGVRDLSSEQSNVILVVDDSCNFGRSMSQAKELLKDKSYEFKYVAVYIKNKNSDVDYYRHQIPQPRAFQWNIFHHTELMELTLFDIDGLLCRKPTPEENDDGDKYKHFILNTQPKYIPSFEVGSIVTSRLEKWRPETEEWLKKNNVKYKNLIMLNYPRGDVRRMMGHHAYHKAEVYRRTNALLFVEDEQWQASQINELTGRPVLCVTDWKIYEGNER